MTIHEIDGRRIRTEFQYPPVPTRNWDWNATEDGVYDGAPDSKPPFNLVGLGATEEAAIEDLMQQLQDYETEQP